MTKSAKTTSNGENSEKLEISKNEHEFILNRVLAGNSWTESYKLTHNTKGLSASAIQARAHRLANTERVKAFISDLRLLGEMEANVTLQSHIERMRQIAEIAISRNQIGAAVKAEENIGRACGLYVTKAEYTHKHESSALSLLEELKDSVDQDQIKH